MGGGYRKKPSQSQFQMSKRNYGLTKPHPQFFRVLRPDGSPNLYKWREDAEGFAGTYSGKARIEPATKEEYMRYLMETMPSRLEADDIDTNVILTKFFDGVEYTQVKQYADQIGGIVYLKDTDGGYIKIRSSTPFEGKKTSSNHRFVVIAEGII